MHILTVILIATSLAMDAFAVSVANGVIIKKRKHLSAFKFGASFGLFQMIMPVIGWAGGRTFCGYVMAIDHWIIFGILSFIGSKMIFEALKMKDIEEVSGEVSLYGLLGLSIATSIDALAVGVSFSLLNISVFMPAAVIGIITFVLSYAGVFIGNKIGHMFENRIEIAGGVLLIIIGSKILFEHII